MNKRSAYLLMLLLVIGIFSSIFIVSADVQRTCIDDSECMPYGQVCRGGVCVGGSSSNSALSQAIGSVSGFIQQVYTEVGVPVATLLVGNTNASGQQLTGDLVFAKFLFFILVFSIVWIALKRIPIFSQYNWALWVGSLVVSLLSIRWIVDEAWIKAIMLPHEAFGIALSAFIPIALMFVLIEYSFSSKVMRKAAWVFSGTVFIFLFLFRSFDAKGNVIDTYGPTYAGFLTPAYIYIVAAIICWALFAYDGTIQGALARSKTEAELSSYKQDRVQELKRDKADLAQDLRNGLINAVDYKTKVKEIDDKISALMKI